MPRDEVVFLLIHGAWHGGWCWEPVAAILRAQGTTVLSPTLRGLGERRHLATPRVGLATHVDEIARLAASIGGRVILVGHSYGGVVAEGVCDRLRGRVAHALFLDSPRPGNGEAALAHVPREALAGRFGPLIDGYLAPPPDIARFGFGPGHGALAAWVAERLTPHPVFTFVEPLKLRHGGSRGLSRTFVRCRRGGVAPTEDAQMRNDPSWTYRLLDCGHDAMLLCPEHTAALLMEAAASAERIMPADPLHCGGGKAGVGRGRTAT